MMRSVMWIAGVWLLTATAGAAPVLYVVDPFDDIIMHRYDGSSGAFLGAFVDVTAINGTCCAGEIVRGPDDLLYVGSGGTNDFLRFRPSSAAYVDTFIPAGSGGLTNTSTPRLAFGPDGNLYVTSEQSNQVLRYDGGSGAFVDAFVSAGAGGLSQPVDLQFNRNGDLLVLTRAVVAFPDPLVIGQETRVLRFDGTTGAFEGIHVAGGTGTTLTANEMIIGPDGNLYISNFFDDSILRYDGESGAFLGTFVAPGSGGLRTPRDLAFGPDGNLYVGAGGNEGTVLRFNGQTGAFIDAYVPAGAGGLNNPVGLAFAEVAAIELAGLPGNNLLLGSPGVSTVVTVPFSGGGGLTVADGSTVILTADHSFTGSLNVGSGTLVVNGSVVGATRLGGPGMVQGSGTFGDLFAPVGTVAPGNSIGTATVNGTFALGPQSTLEIELDATGQSDRVIVNGNVDLGSSTLRLIAADGDYQPLTDYLIISNDGSDAIVGEFAAVELDLDLRFLSPMVTTTGGDGNDVVVTLARNAVSLAAAATRGNQHVVATALEAHLAGTTIEPGSLGSRLLLLDESRATRALDTLNGELHAMAAPSLLAARDTLDDLLAGRIGRLRAYRGAGARAASFGLAHTETAVADIDAPGSGASSVAWFSGLGSAGGVDADNNASALDFDYAGFAVGIDRPVGRAFLVGGYTSYVRHGIDRNDAADSLEIDDFRVGGYAAWRKGQGYLAANVGYGRQEYDSTRGVVVGALRETARADYAGNLWSGAIEAGYLSSWHGYDIRPSLALGFAALQRNRARERDAPLAALDLADDTHDALTSRIGLRASRTVKRGSVTWTPALAVAWIHQFTPTAQIVESHLVRDAIDMRLRGPRMPRDQARVSARLGFSAWRDVSAFAGYSGSFSNTAISHAAMIGLTLAF